MKKLIIVLLLICLLAVPAQAMDITAPEVPESGQDLMPAEQSTFGEDLWYIIKSAVARLEPDLAEAAASCMGVMGIVMLLSVLQTFPEVTKRVTDLASAVAIGGILLSSANSLIHLGVSTVEELSEYGKLLLPVMTTIMAAQGGTTTSAALYAGTALFDSILSAVVSKLIVPMIYIFLALAASSCASEERMLKKLRDFVKWLATWCLKIVLYVFTGYIGITGVVSGSADAAALKATKLTISGMVPVVGSILSDASEAVLVGAGVVKSTAGIYGLLAILSVFMEPFLKIGVHYLLLKLTCAVSGVFGGGRAVDLIQDFSSAMGLLLAMTGTVCLMLLISTVCFMKGVL